MSSLDCWVLSQLRSHAGNRADSWHFLSEPNGEPVTKKRANKFLAGAILDYQIPAATAWKNARRLAEDILGDPEDLWDAIAGIGERQWKSDSLKEAYRLHRFRKQAHDRLWRIGCCVREQYAGDAREIWVGEIPSVVLERLCAMRVGEQISRMVVGALIDTEQIIGRGELKADLHVRRILGRVFAGGTIDAGRASRIADRLVPGNSWSLDEPLYRLGKKVCKKSNPNCCDCYLMPKCNYARDSSGTGRKYGGNALRAKW